ncbi:DNA gyrase inhibitor YacG [Alphaproteobacteria bacterium]|nr:DNA gyrase inhibitor YacG [Alphaproteobacteria bacterium]
MSKKKLINNNSLNSTCRICKSTSTAKFYPFCSKRCASIDFSNWIGERYSITADEDTNRDDIDENLDFNS